jgi:hypothetical protein
MPREALLKAPEESESYISASVEAMDVTQRARCMGTTARLLYYVANTPHFRDYSLVRMAQPRQGHRVELRNDTTSARQDLLKYGIDRAIRRPYFLV